LRARQHVEIPVMSRVAIAAGLAVLALAACGGSSSSTKLPTHALVTIDVGPKGVSGGPVHATVAQGAKVTLVVHSALGDEVHVHGYDLHSNVPAGGTTRISFTASIAGQFVVELESRSLQIAQLEVR
jgi:hypothetical protein